MSFNLHCFSLQPSSPHLLNIIPTMYPSTPFRFWARTASNFHCLSNHHVRLPTNAIRQSIPPTPYQISTFSTSTPSLAKGVRQKVDRRISTPLPFSLPLLSPIPHELIDTPSPNPLPPQPPQNAAPATLLPPARPPPLDHPPRRHALQRPAAPRPRAGARETI